MLIMLICLVVFLIGFLLNRISDDCLDILEITGSSLMMFCGIMLAIGLMCKPVCDLQTKAEIREFKSIRLTLETARTNENNLEVAAIQTKVMDWNAWLASNKYYKTTLLSWWVPSDVLDLEPIE